MKRKLLFLGAASVAMLLGTQASFAQTGGIYTGADGMRTTPVTGIASSSIIQFEDFDLGNNQNAAPATYPPTAFPANYDPNNYVPSMNPGVGPFGYSDGTAGNTAGNGTSFLFNNYRPGTDVDLGKVASGVSMDEIGAGINGNEFLYYTIVVTDNGKYHADVNYGHGNTTGPRRVKFELLDTAFLNTPVLLASGTLIRTTLSTNFATNPVTDNPNNTGITTNGNTLQFDIAAGTYVIKFTALDSGPVFNWFEIIRDGDATTFGVNDFEGNSKVNVYPNPSSTGVFNIGESAKWEAYSVLGAKIASGEGTEVNLSAAAKGIYFIKTAKGTAKVSIQ